MTTDTNPCSDNKQLVHRFMDECWNLGKFESLREMVADDCRIHDPVFPSLTSGVENLKRHIRNLTEVFSLPVVVVPLPACGEPNWPHCAHWCGCACPSP